MMTDDRQTSVSFGVQQDIPTNFYNKVAFVSNNMMISSNGNIFRVTGPLGGDFTGLRWIPLTRASDAELWCFLWSAPEQTVE